MINKDLAVAGIFPAQVLEEDKIYLLTSYALPATQIFFEENKDDYPVGLWCAPNEKATRCDKPASCWVTFEDGDVKRPIILGFMGKDIKAANFGGGSSSTNSTNYISNNGTVSSGSVSIVGGELTIADLQKCANRQEYLNLVMPIFKEYCLNNAHGVIIKYPGVLALQPFFEVSANFPQGLSNVAIKDNNLGGLKYSSSIPGATVGSSVPENEKASGPDNYCHFNTVSEYFYAQVWNATGSTYSLAHQQQQSVTSFARTFLNIWVKGIFSVPSGDVAYSKSLLSEYNKYNLSAYEN